MRVVFLKQLLELISGVLLYRPREAVGDGIYPGQLVEIALALGDSNAAADPLVHVGRTGASGRPQYPEGTDAPDCHQPRARYSDSYW